MLLFDNDVGLGQVIHRLRPPDGRTTEVGVNLVINPQSRGRVMRNALLAACRARISSWLAALLTLLSGGAMTAAGYLLRILGWATAGLVMIPGGVLILVALRLAQRRQPTTQDGAAQTPAVSGMHAATQLLGNLSMPEGLPLRSQFVILGLTMASGAVMVIAGYAWAAQSWIWAATLAAVGGLFISGAFARAAQPRRDRYGPRQDGVIT